MESCIQEKYMIFMLIMAYVFDGIPKDLSKIVKKIIKNKVDDVDFISQSAFNKKVTKGFSLPDLSSINVLDKRNIKKNCYYLKKNIPKKKTIKIQKFI